MPTGSHHKLERYHDKRSPGQTPEPAGGAAPEPLGEGPKSERGIFVVQKHHASSLHWDLRLEMDGVLESWAVPKGPSPDPADKRLAMHVEPHPLEYAEFEGVIPEGQYGAGPSICWDKGIWIEIPGDKHGIEHGKLLFELRGYKLRGRWTLVHTPKRGGNHWLLIKERDGHVDERGSEAFPDDSIYSGLLVDQLAHPEKREAEIVEQARELGAAVESSSRSGKADGFQVMLATVREEPFTKEGWVFEIKYDGYRLIANQAEGEPVLWSRNGNDITATFPDIARAVRGLPYDRVVLDGEVVVHDEAGLPSFSLLQRRGRLQRSSAIARAALDLPAVFYAFDLLAFGGLDLRDLPLLARKALLREVLPTVGPVRFSDHIATQGEAMYEQVTAMRLEGLVAKKADSPYRSGRSTSWYKIRAVRTDDFVVVGYTDPKGGRSGFGALHLAQYAYGNDYANDGELIYAGSVGTGFSDDMLDEIMESLRTLEAASDVDPGASGGKMKRPTLAGSVPKGPSHHWIRPELVAEVRYKEFTSAGVIRHPSFVGLRDDKSPEECVRQDEDGGEARRGAGGGEGAKGGGRPDPMPVTVDAVDRTVHFTNLDKVLWPETGYTKGDLIEYYRAVWEWIEPYLRDRCLVLTRYPDGIDGKSFYQKNAPDWAPEWVRTESVWSESSEKPIDYFVVEDVETLLYVANSAAIPLHVWSSRVATIDRPDWCILDLDPKGAPFGDVVKVARAIRGVCEDIELPTYVKTSGSSGLHVLVPLGHQCDYEQSRQLGHLLAQVVVSELPEIATITRTIRDREGKVYVDFLQNRRAQLLVVPFSVRPVPEAAVSTPLKWSEVMKSLDIRKHTIKTVPARMKRLKGGDPFSGVLEDRPDLIGALERLARRTG
jgi:bifunctional non-homologous end joining protein LigD